MQRIVLAALFFCCAAHQSAQAANFEIAFDSIVAGSFEELSGGSNHGVSLRSNTSFTYGGDFAAGIMVNMEVPNGSVFEIVLGPTLRYGKPYFGEFGFGYLFSDYGSFYERGSFFRFVFGRRIELAEDWRLKISLPIVLKFVTSDLASRTVVDYVPYLGVSYLF